MLTKGQKNFLVKISQMYPNVDQKLWYKVRNRFYGDEIRVNGSVILAYKYALDCESKFHKESNTTKQRYLANQRSKARDLMISLNPNAYTVLLD